MITKQKTNNLENLDSLIKFVLTAALACLPFFIEKQLNYVILFVFLLGLTFVLRVNLRTLMVSAASYCLIVLLPYFFGLLLSGILYLMTDNSLFGVYQGYYEVSLRLFRLSVVWYVSMLYFQTTSIETVIGLLDRLFSPLKFIGVPVPDYLKVVMYVVIELRETGTEVVKNLREGMRSNIGSKKRKFQINITGVSQIIVSLLVNSFEKIDKVQSFVENANPEDLYGYSFKLTKREIAAISSFVFLTTVVSIVENGY